jgi:hypothetical protein
MTMPMTLNTKLKDAVCRQLDSPKGRRLGEAGCHVLLAMAKFTDAAGLACAPYETFTQFTGLTASPVEFSLHGLRRAGFVDREGGAICRIFYGPEPDDPDRVLLHPRETEIFDDE